MSGQCRTNHGKRLAHCVVEMALAVTHGGALGRCDDDAEFTFAFGYILGGLARLHSG